MTQVWQTRNGVDSWPYFQRESIVRTAVWNAVRRGNIVSRIGFAPKIGSAGRKFEERRRERNSCVHIEGTSNRLLQWISRSFGYSGIKWTRFERRSFRIVLRYERIEFSQFLPRRVANLRETRMKFVGGGELFRVYERRKRESERVIKRWSNFFLKKKKERFILENFC